MIKLELPEIETLRRDLEREVVTRKIKVAEAHSLKSFPGIKTKAAFGADLVGAKVTDVTRLGLHIVISLSNDHSLVIELGDHGRLRMMASKEKTTDSTVGVVTFTQGGDLRLFDTDGSSAIQVVATENIATVLPDPNDVGLDPQSEPVSWVTFGRILHSHKVPLKLLLCDPTVFVGIGEVYSNEILFDAGLKYDRLSNGLSTQEIRRLYRSVANVVHEAIKSGGTSLDSRPFFNLAGEPGQYAENLAVYGRAGELSPRSREPIRKTSFKHHIVYFCNTQV